VKTHSRATWTSVLVLVVVFGSGLIVGAAVDGVGSKAATAAEPEAAESEPRERDRPRMYEQVGITDEQQAVVDSIVVANRTLLRANRAEMDSIYRTIVLETREAIKGVMNEDQRARYDALLAEYDARRAAREEEEREGGERRE
jgi:hypothetical protein